MNEVEMEHRLTAVEKLGGSNKHRIDDLEADYQVLHELSTSVKVMAEQLKTMNEKFNRMDATVQTLRDRPGGLWDSAVKTIVTALLGGIVGYALFKLGLK